jgi:hypothetical protein
MNWKEFLKPNLKKIILTPFFFLFILPWIIPVNFKFNNIINFILIIIYIFLSYLGGCGLTYLWWDRWVIFLRRKETTKEKGIENWKDFLKPTKMKMVIFLNFGIILFLFGAFSLFWLMSEIENPVYDMIVKRFSIIIFFILIGVVFLAIQGPYAYLENLGFPAIILALILIIFYWHILSCLIVWIYEKVKKK